MNNRRIPWYYLNPRDGTEMVLIPGGWFFMGNNEEDDPDAYGSEAPRHLHFVRPFYMAITCVTVAQFRRFVKETGHDAGDCLLYTSPSPRDLSTSRMPSSA